MFYLNLLRASLVLIPFVLGCFVYRKLDKGTRFLIFFLGVMILVEIIGFLTVFSGFESYWLDHVYTLCEFCFVTAILSCWQSEPKKRKAFLFALPPFFITWLIAKFTFESLHQLSDGYTAAMAAVILVFMSAFTLIGLFSTRFTLDSFHRDPRFWISCTFLFFYAGSSIGLATMNETLLQGQRDVFIFPIFTFLDIIQYTGYTGGLLCFLPRRIFGGLLSLER